MSRAQTLPAEAFPRRAVVVWAVLVVITGVTFWLGADHPLAAVSVRLGSALAIVLAFVKVWFVGMDFMEIRHAPTALKVVFHIWLAVIGGGLLALYLL